jgi:RNA polymerase sigma-70 factor (ECF subfamily)
MFFPRKTAQTIPLALEAAPAAPMTHAETIQSHFEDHHGALYRFLRSCGVSPSLAEDFTQESFLRLHRHLLDRRPTPNVRAWLCRVGYRLWVDHLRDGHREFPAPSAGIWDSWTAALPDQSPSAEARILARERAVWLRGAVARLSQLERQCLHLRADGLQYKEIAGVLGVSYWSVVEAVRRALDTLGEQVNEL